MAPEKSLEMLPWGGTLGNEETDVQGRASRDSVLREPCVSEVTRGHSTGKRWCREWGKHGPRWPFHSRSRLPLFCPLSVFFAEAEPRGAVGQESSREG